MDPIILHGWPFSPHVRAIRIALAEKPAPYTLREVSPAALGTPEFRALNPFGQVPVLQQGALVLPESIAILHWVAAALPGPALLPADPAGRARAMAVMLQAAHHLYPTGVMRLFIAEAYVAANGGTPDQTAVAAAAEATAPLLDRFPIAGPWVLGEAFTLADILLGAMLHPIRLTARGEAMVAARPALAAWAARVEARPSFRETLVPVPLFGLG